MKYNFKKIIFNDGVLQKSIDITYIINIGKNLDNIKLQLSSFHPTNIIYIINTINKIDAFLEIFKHANKKNFNNILILEDDFIFSDKIKLVEHQNNLNNILLHLKNTDFIYLLGCIPYVQIPYDLHNYRVISAGTHAVIYSLKNRIKTLSLNQTEIKDWDFYNNQNLNRLTYQIPLCYQLFPETDNSKLWCKDYGNNIFMQLSSKIFTKIYKLLNLDTNIEPGTYIFYYSSKLLSLIIFSLFLFLLFHKIIQKDFTSILGFIFILASIHRILLKKERQNETKNFNIPNYTQYIIIFYEFITGILLVFKNKYTDIALKLLLVFLILGSIKLMTIHEEKIIKTYKDAWTFKPSMLSLTFHIYMIFIIIILIVK